MNSIFLLFAGVWFMGAIPVFYLLGIAQKLGISTVKDPIWAFPCALAWCLIPAVSITAGIYKVMP